MNTTALRSRGSSKALTVVTTDGTIAVDFDLEHPHLQRLLAGLSPEGWATVFSSAAADEVWQAMQAMAGSTDVDAVLAYANNGASGWATARRNPALRLVTTTTKESR